MTLVFEVFKIKFAYTFLKELKMKIEIFKSELSIFYKVIKVQFVYGMFKTT